MSVQVKINRAVLEMLGFEVDKGEDLFLNTGHNLAWRSCETRPHDPSLNHLIEFKEDMSHWRPCVKRITEYLTREPKAQEPAGTFHTGDKVEFCSDEHIFLCYDPERPGFAVIRKYGAVVPTVFTVSVSDIKVARTAEQKLHDTIIGIIRDELEDDEFVAKPHELRLWEKTAERIIKEVIQA